MSAGAPPSTPDSLSSRVSSPSDLSAMPPSPPPSPPAVAEDEVRPWPPMKMKLFPYALHCVCDGMGRTGEILLLAFFVIHYLHIIVRCLAVSTEGGQARFWTFVSGIMASLCFGFTTFIMCVFIRYMRVDGVYHLEFDPPLQHQAAPAAAEQLPPPPPEMDMC